MNRHVINSDASITDALKMLNALSGDAMTLLVTDSKGRMLGTLTDGDIRRALIGGLMPASPVSSAMNTTFRMLKGDCNDIDRLRAARRRGLRLLPKVDAEGFLTDVIDTAVTRSLLPLDAIIMAGGKGERLRPLTLSVPKPLLMVAGKPIIDYNIESLKAHGVKRITVTVNYLAEELERHFATAEGVACIRESKPLGTIGAASLISHRPGGATIVMNSDLLTTISFEDMYMKHIAEEADITVAAIPYNLSVPYAILTTDGSRITGIEEKPSYSYYANAGIYIISNDLLASLPGDERTDATDLIEQALDSGRKVVYFPISGTWIDIGTHADYKHACELMAHHEQMSL
jgi:dTDP-glucose pyrophosphorylase